jgi:hypothetical protein
VNAFTHAGTAPGPRPGAAIQESLLTDAELEEARPGHTDAWNPRGATQYTTGVHRGWHAIARSAAEHAVTKAAVGGPPPVAVAACGELVRVADRHGTYDRMSDIVRGHPCRPCAWTVAIATGSTGRELSLITPGPRDAAAIARSGADPMLAAAVCQAILAAESGGDTEYGLDHPATVQILAHATRHRPVLLVPEDCAEDPRSCEHRPADEDAVDWQCDYPDVTVACGACTLHAGGWAGEWEGSPMDECTVPVPCSVLLTLAARYGITRPHPPVQPCLAY